jgi:hypothetical protein
MMLWFHNNEEQCNPKGYPICMFVVYLQSVPAKANVIKLGHAICTNINAVPGNNTTITVNLDSFFWISHPVWEDIIGSHAALKMLLEKTTNQPPHPGWWEQYSAMAPSFFCSQHHSFDLAHFLHASIDEVHLDEHLDNPEVEKNQDIHEHDEDADVGEHDTDEEFGLNES